ncbi:acetylornithine deacetylase [Porticoccus litoralis]|uniref:Acetylornithine deacetylase n=1 Tax=Porticoccus litoralis TaxID=434086 RepID=A0AAW8B4M8_9GAMM|nr:acetylornithine deacetylase [Porticoccus litoralis]MDP1520936.1 acetylornithine deacetylase [Porticoccus litoralis]
MQLIPMLQRLIAANSISSVNADIDQGNREVIELLAQWLSDLGFATEVMPLADPRKANLIATLGSGPGGLVLAGHTDTVPCDDSLWSQDPFKMVEKNHRLYGLGTCDMKGFFPLVIEAAKQFVSTPLKQPLIILATADEESSMAGAQMLAAAGRPRARYALIGEPTGMKPINMHKGIMVEKLVIEGRSGHSSDPSLGRNAMETMHSALGELLKLRDELRGSHNNPAFQVAYPTMNLGCIHGGNNPNRICGRCELGFEIRPLPGMDMTALQQQISERILPLQQRDDVMINIDHYCVPAFATEPHSSMVKICEALTHHSCESVSFATEAPYLKDLGMDVVILGPGSVQQAHQPDEYLPLERIQPTVDFLIQLIGRCCL